MNEEQATMRSVVIYGSADTDLVDQLSCIPGWKLERFHVDGVDTQCLSRAEEKVVLRIIAPNVICTSNVLPHDSDRNQHASNALLQQLSQALDNIGIEHGIVASVKDLA